MCIPRFLALGFAALAAGAAARADIPYISPDGRTVAFVGEALDPKPTRDQIRVVDVDCLMGASERSTCDKIVFEGRGMPGKISWAKDSASFIRTGSLGFWFKKIGGGAEGAQPERRASNISIDPLVFDPELFPTHGQGRDTPVDDDLFRLRILNGFGDIIGDRIDEDFDTWIETPDGSKHSVPDEIAWLSGSARQKFEIGSAAWTKDIHVWSASMGDAGVLQVIDQAGVHSIELPTGVFGPARMAWNVSDGSPLGLIDPFGFYPLPSRGGELGWLMRSISDLRAADPSLELLTVSATTDGRTAIVQFRQGLTCTRLYVIRPDQTHFVDRTCAQGREDFGAPSVTPQIISGDGYLLKGRLYSWSGVRSPQGLLIVFEGGPQSNSNEQPPWIASNALWDRFDVLVVDFRGSTGFGWRYLTDLKQPLSDVSTQDVQAAIAWARGQPQFADKAVGFWGDSWGGYAGLLALTRKAGKLDFVISNSGFIENPPDGGVRCSIGIFRQLFGADENKNCRSAQLANETPKSPVPLLMIIGDQDKQAWPHVARTWIAAAKMSGACVGIVSSASGGHALGWPEKPRSEAMTAISDWVTAALARRPEACDVNRSLE